jgi:tRNA threonylcarbamoyladenosine biosynthesis protein TsaE
MNKILEVGLDEINSVADAILGCKKNIILLTGDLSSGKTTLCKHLVQLLGYDGEVLSPTFSIMQEYGDGICHYDIYNIKTDGFIQKGFVESLFDGRYHIIEWADEALEKKLKIYGVDYLKIDIAIKEDKRVYRIQSA